MIQFERIDPCSGDRAGEDKVKQETGRQGETGGSGRSRVDTGNSIKGNAGKTGNRLRTGVPGSLMREKETQVKGVDLGMSRQVRVCGPAGNDPHLLP